MIRFPDPLQFRAAGKGRYRRGDIKMPQISDCNYPKKYESTLRLKNGSEVFLRPVLPTDGPLLVGLFDRLSEQSLYLRFLRHIRALPEDMLRRFTQIDYDSEFALAVVIEEDGKYSIIAVGRYAFDPAEKIADIAVAVRDDWQNLGIGRAILARTIAAGKEHGYSRFGSMMDPRNTAIKKILADLGLRVKFSPKSGFFQVDISA